MCSISLLLFAIALTWTLVSAVPHPILPSSNSLSKAAKQGISDRNQSITFKVPCLHCPSVFKHDVALDFEVQYPRLSPWTNLCHVPFALNGKPITVDQKNLGQVSSLQIPSGNAHDQWDVDLVIQGFCDPVVAQRALFFNITRVAHLHLLHPDTFTLILGKSEPPQILIDSEIPRIADQSDCTTDIKSVVNETSAIRTDIEAIRDDNDNQSSAAVHRAENQLRRRLYDQTTKLQKLNESCRKTTSTSLAGCHGDMSCVTRIMCKRIHDTALVTIKQVQTLLQGSVMITKGRDQQVQASLQVSSIEWEFDQSSQASSKSTSQHPVVIALEILAAAFGLTSLCAFLRRRFCSLRRRVDRLADREERRRARHFRCLARREALRKKWIGFKRVFRLPSRNGDYEEKRALVLEAAGPLIDDYAEASNDPDPEMGLALGGLRGAHEFVASLVHINRVRKSSSAGSGNTTLPEYTEEKLPDYTSTPLGEGYAASIASSSINGAVTPESSIVMSPRCSGETIRTETDFSSG